MTHPGDVEAGNIHIIRQYLERWFRDVTPDPYTERFVYHDGTQTSEPALDGEFVNDLSPQRLKAYIEQTVLPYSVRAQGRSFEQGPMASLSGQDRRPDPPPTDTEERSRS